MILVDPRVGSRRKGQRASHDVTPLFDKLGIEYVKQTLPSGDFSLIGNGPDGALKIGVELKQVADLVSSIHSGRMAEQIIKMAQEYDRVYLIVEGPYRASRQNGMLEVPRGRRYRPLFAGTRRPVFWVDVERFLTGVGEAGVRVIKTRTSWETVKTITQVLDTYWNKPYADHKSLAGLIRPQVFALTQDSEALTRVRQVAACLPGIGIERSKAVAQAFGSVYEIAAAGLKEWGEIEGVGKQIAQRAYDAIREDCR